MTMTVGTVKGKQPTLSSQREAARGRNATYVSLKHEDGDARTLSR